MPRPHDPRDRAFWYRLAETEARAVISSLPEDLRGRLDRITVRCEDRPGKHLLEEGWPDDLLGLFSGPAVGEELSSNDVLPPQIKLFVDNLRDEAGDDPQAFRQEVRTTLLHEIGHYLGLEEDDLEARDLG
jgi:predicted Zn-dependent protease with MMP-like domain